MVAEVKIKLKPFTVPNYVMVDGGKVSGKYHLRDLPKSEVLKLCEDFKKSVLEKHNSKDEGPVTNYRTGSGC